MNRTHLPVILLGAAAIVVAHLLDPFAFRYLRIENVYGEDWGRMLRVMGFLPLWIVGGIVLWLYEPVPRPKPYRSRGALLVAGAAVGGIVAELTKIVLRRLRPGDLGDYAFRPWGERTFSSGGLGLPSSHALVAFGAAAVLARMFPRAWWVWWPLAWGCALTRVAAGAHFLSDVVVAAVLGWLVGAMVWRWRDPSTVAAA